jgi:hypothetical protein
MVRDSRKSNETRSGFKVFVSGDSGTSKDLVTVRNGATLSLDNFTMSYDSGGSATCVVELYDSPEGTAAGDLEDQLASYILSPGDFEDLSDRSLEDIEDDLIVVVESNDAEVHITGEAYITTG